MFYIQPKFKPYGYEREQLLSLCVCVCVCVLSVCLSLCLSVHPICLSVCISCLSVCISCLSFCMYILSVCLSVYPVCLYILSVYQYTLSVCLYILSICLTVCPYILSFFLSVCLSPYDPAGKGGLFPLIIVQQSPSRRDVPCLPPYHPLGTIKGNGNSAALKAIAGNGKYLSHLQKEGNQGHFRAPPIPF